jgi:hypothetical protein
VAGRRGAPIASALLGTVDLIPRRSDGAEFQSWCASMARGVANVELRVWTPRRADLFVKQVAPNLEDLTSRRTQVNARLRTRRVRGRTRAGTTTWRYACRPSRSARGAAARVQVALGEEVQT